MVRDEGRAMVESTRLQAACGQAAISVDDNAASSGMSQSRGKDADVSLWG